MHRGFWKVAVSHFGEKIKSSSSLSLLEVYENLAMKKEIEKPDDLTVRSDSSRPRTQTSWVLGSYTPSPELTVPSPAPLNLVAS